MKVKKFMFISLLLLCVLFLGGCLFSQYVKPFEDPRNCSVGGSSYQQMEKDQEICEMEAEKLKTKSTITKLLYVDQCMMHKGYISFGDITVRSKIDLYEKYHDQVSK